MRAFFEKLRAVFGLSAKIDPEELAAIDEQARQHRREEGAFSPWDVK